MRDVASIEREMFEQRQKTLVERKMGLFAGHQQVIPPAAVRPVLNIIEALEQARFLPPFADLASPGASTTPTDVADGSDEDTIFLVGTDEIKALLQRKLEILEELVDSGKTLDGVLGRQLFNTTPFDCGLDILVSNFEQRLRCENHRQLLLMTLNHTPNLSTVAAASTEPSKVTVIKLTPFDHEFVLRRILAIVEIHLADSLRTEDYLMHMECATIRRHVVSELAVLFRRNAKQLRLERQSQALNEWMASLQPRWSIWRPKEMLANEWGVLKW